MSVVALGVGELDVDPCADWASPHGLVRPTFETVPVQAPERLVLVVVSDLVAGDVVVNRTGSRYTVAAVDVLSAGLVRVRDTGGNTVKFGFGDLQVEVVS